MFEIKYFIILIHINLTGGKFLHQSQEQDQVTIHVSSSASLLFPFDYILNLIVSEELFYSLKVLTLMKYNLTIIKEDQDFEENYREDLKLFTFKHLFAPVFFYNSIIFQRNAKNDLQDWKRNF